MGAPTGRLQGKRALVTGSGTGIGRETALEFARQGAVVALHYSHSADGARTAAEEIRSAGGRAEAFVADFRQAEAAAALAEAALGFLGGLDVLVNNAGITLALAFEKVTPEQLETVYAVNVRTPFFLTQRLVPALEASGGAIINLTSVHAFAGYPGHAVYAGTKGAIVAQSRELAIELAPRGIRVNAVAPGAVPVENHAKVGAETDPAVIGPLIPCGFPGTPLDIARVVAFLASDEARYVVGQTVTVDGGTTSWLAFSDAFRHPGDTPFGRGYVPGV